MGLIGSACTALPGVGRAAAAAAAARFTVTTPPRVCPPRPPPPPPAATVSAPAPGRGALLAPAVSPPTPRGLHSSTYRLHVSAFSGISWVYCDVGVKTAQVKT